MAKQTATAKPDAKELERRRKISESARKSEAGRLYHDSLRGVKRGPESAEIRAKKSASKKAMPGTPAWKLHYKQALERIQLEDRQDRELERLYKRAAS